MKISKRDAEAFFRTCFMAFLEKVFCILNPGQTFIPGWYIEALPTSWNASGAARYGGSLSTCRRDRSNPSLAR